jgi:hypothetical protein
LAKSHIRLLRITGSTLRRITFNDIPEESEIVCRVNDIKLIEELFTLAPPAFMIFSKHSFVYVYVFPKPKARRLEEVITGLVSSIRESAEATGLEFDVKMKLVEGEETVIVRVGKILSPAERRKRVLLILSKYSGRFESEFKRRLFSLR